MQKIMLRIVRIPVYLSIEQKFSAAWSSESWSPLFIEERMFRTSSKLFFSG